MQLLLFFLSWIAMTTAQVNFEDWRPAGNGDVRSPCPALNALANHNILPRNGRGLTMLILVKALGDGLNVSTEVAKTLATAGIAISPNAAKGSLDLDNLNAHNLIEHDGSLSREDYDLGGKSQAFCPRIFQETLSYFNGVSEIGFPEVAAARWGRIQTSKRTNPKMLYGPQQVFESYSESAVYFQLLKKAGTQTAPVDWIKIFFSELADGSV
jgi:hypothetical protein